MIYNKCSLDSLDSKVRELIQSFGIKLISYKQAHSLGISKQELPSDLSAGAYVCYMDIIAYNSTPPIGFEDINRTILHEIVHWTGHGDRLKRKPIQLGQRMLYAANSMDELHTEEAIAEIGMYRLAVYLGLEKDDKYLDLMIHYLSRYELAHIDVACREATKAVNFIVEQMERKAA
jgi:antirestriction protein ArdC